MKSLKPSYALDGGIAGAPRQVRAGGWVKFAGEWWQSEKLKEWELTEVWVSAGDYWMQFISVNLIIYNPHPHIVDWICDIHGSKSSEERKILLKVIGGHDG